MASTIFIQSDRPIQLIVTVLLAAQFQVNAIANPIYHGHKHVIELSTWGGTIDPEPILKFLKKQGHPNAIQIYPNT